MNFKETIKHMSIGKLKDLRNKLTIELKLNVMKARKFHDKGKHMIKRVKYQIAVINNKLYQMELERCHQKTLHQI